MLECLRRRRRSGVSKKVNNQTKIRSTLLKMPLSIVLCVLRSLHLCVDVRWVSSLRFPAQTTSIDLMLFDHQDIVNVRVSMKWEKPSIALVTILKVSISFSCSAIFPTLNRALSVSESIPIWSIAIVYGVGLCEGVFFKLWSWFFVVFFLLELHCAYPWMAIGKKKFHVNRKLYSDGASTRAHKLQNLVIWEIEIDSCFKVWSLHIFFVSLPLVQFVIAHIALDRWFNCRCVFTIFFSTFKSI